MGDDLGLDVTNEEIVKQLVTIPGFIKDGKFDKETYIKVLNQNRTNPTEFEATLKRDLLLQKVESIFKIQAGKNELENLNKLLFSQDDISIQILNSNDVTVDITEDELKKYWELNKNNYKSEPAVELEIQEVPLLSETFTDEGLLKTIVSLKLTIKKN